MTPILSILLIQVLAGFPADRDPSVARWAEKNVKTFGARGEQYDSSKTPWCIEPLERTDDGITRVITFVKPVQGGGSVVGEASACRWISCHSNGDIQWNWEGDVKAGERWDKRLSKIMKGCKPVFDRIPKDPTKDKRGLIIFPHCNLTVQGVNSDANLASDSIRFQINEEIHGWDQGKLKTAYGRTTAYWNSVTLNISNASEEGDQLHEALLSGTHQHWEVKCPGCGEFHRLRTRFEADKPELGGLRYDATDCRLDDGGYDYNKLAKTIRYQMPCGHLFYEQDRRALSLTGRYSAPTNPGALLTHRSYTLEGVSIDYIPFLTLIQEKHEALRALKRGDPGPWIKYLRERECRFHNPEDRPLVGKIIVMSGTKRNREGLRSHAEFWGRLFALDYQRGEISKGEAPYWWLVIRDFLTSGDSRLVFEGKEETDGNCEQQLKDHKCVGIYGVADSGHAAAHVYQFCFKNGINAIKGGNSDLYSHGDDGKKIYSQKTPLWQIANYEGPKFDYVSYSDGYAPHKDEPMFWQYSKAGIRDRLSYLRSTDAIKWEVPEDVSENYKRHMESEYLETEQVGRGKQNVTFWKQTRKRNDLFVCECYIAMRAEEAGLIGR